MGSERRRERLAVLPAREVQAIAQQIHDARLHRGLRERRLDGVDQARQAVHHSNQHILHPARAQLVEDLETELRALGLLDLEAEHRTGPIGEHAQRHGHGLDADPHPRPPHVDHPAGIIPAAMRQLS